MKHLSMHMAVGLLILMIYARREGKHQSCVPKGLTVILSSLPLSPLLVYMQTTQLANTHSLSNHGDQVHSLESNQEQRQNKSQSNSPIHNCNIPVLAVINRWNGEMIACESEVAPPLPRLLPALGTPTPPRAQHQLHNISLIRCLRDRFEAL